MLFERTGTFTGHADNTVRVKTFMSPPPPGVATTINGLLIVARGGVTWVPVAYQRQAVSPPTLGISGLDPQSWVQYKVRIGGEAAVNQ